MFLINITIFVIEKNLEFITLSYPNTHINKIYLLQTIDLEMKKFHEWYSRVPVPNKRRAIFIHFERNFTCLQTYLVAYVYYFESLIEEL